ncbi:MAG: trehalose-phosphatase, partial [Chloroflexota bacterium]|nr:trehalose-phosphatase [Chloroflexota bacterium]
MDNLLDRWPDVSRQLVRAQHVVLLCDFDGTLAPISERPETVYLSPRAKGLLEVLAAWPRCTVGIISGRSLVDLKARAAMPGLILAGNHGLEIEGPGQAFVHPISVQVVPLFKLMERVLIKGLAAVKGAFVENKGLTLTVHYRLVEPGREGEVKQLVDRIVGVPRLLGKVRVTRGKKVFELRPPVVWDKGKAVSHILAHHLRLKRVRKAAVIFLGDDTTDEDAFLVVNGLRGLSVRVGRDERPTAARYSLDSVQEVED